jgi:hypothetical protein
LTQLKDWRGAVTVVGRRMPGAADNATSLSLAAGRIWT